MNKKTDGFFFSWHVHILIDSEKISGPNFIKIVFLHMLEEGRCKSMREFKDVAYENQGKLRPADFGLFWRVLEHYSQTV